MVSPDYNSHHGVGVNCNLCSGQKPVKKAQKTKDFVAFFGKI